MSIEGINSIFSHFETKPKPELYEYTKRLGQQHFADRNSSTTICGMPMLGNNYARVYDESQKTLCGECKKKIKE